MNSEMFSSKSTWLRNGMSFYVLLLETTEDNLNILFVCFDNDNAQSIYQ